MMISPSQLTAFGGTLSLGAFLATLNIFKEIGKELAEIYTEFMEIQGSIGPLRSVLYLMNLETDLQLRMSINRMRREQGEKQRQEARSSSKETFAVDTIPIALTNMSFKYPDKPRILNQVNITFDQGKMYAFVGPPHQGKATLLKLLGQVLLPEMGEEDSGTLFTPPHLRVLHLSPETLFLDGTLLTNLIFNTDIKKVGGIARIKKICKLLHFPKEMLESIQEPHGEGGGEASSVESGDSVFRSWLSHLSHSDYPRVSLARALIMNPECLVLHKPAMSFDTNEGKNVLSLVRRHVDERGLELPEAGRKWRRCRTVFFSSTTQQGLALADGVYDISVQQGVKAISKEEAAEELTKRASMAISTGETP